MKEKIIEKATEMFLKLGFKSITMDDIAAELGISKKTIYKFFNNKEELIEECTETTHCSLMRCIETIIAEKYDPIKENIEIRKMLRDTLRTADTSPLYQLKKHYPEIHAKVVCFEEQERDKFWRQNIERGIELGLYRKDIDIDRYIKFYYVLIFHINDTTVLEHEAQELELAALEYHTRAIATPKGVIELEKHLATYNN